MLNFETDVVQRAASSTLQEMHEREAKIGFEDVVNIQFTSGTTGYPKGVTITHHGCLNNAYYTGERFDF